MTAATSRRFTLNRTRDHSGVSGVDVVAHGVVFPDGTCALRWDTHHRWWRPRRRRLKSTGVYDDIRTLEAIHGHGGSTRIEFIDGQAAA